MDAGEREENEALERVYWNEKMRCYLDVGKTQGRVFCCCLEGDPAEHTKRVKKIVEQIRAEAYQAGQASTQASFADTQAAYNQGYAAGVAEEREWCAKIAEDWIYWHDYEHGDRYTGAEIAAALRAGRGEQP